MKWLTCLAVALTFALAVPTPADAGKKRGKKAWRKKGKPKKAKPAPPPEPEPQPDPDPDRDKDDAGAAKGAPMKIATERLFNRAIALYQEENYRGAADKLAEAHKAEPRNDILFAWAQAERLARNCKKATELYHRLRKEDLDDQDKLGVLEGLERCGAFDEALEAEAKIKQIEEKQKARELARQNPPSPWYSDWIGDTLLISGIVGLGVGTTFWVISDSEASDAEDAFSYEHHVELEDRARTHRFISIATLSVGAGLIGGAIARYITRDDGSSGGERAVSATGWLTDGAGGFAIGGRF
jgi:tetratricopeptide (TPR) repeat protein